MTTRIRLVTRGDDAGSCATANRAIRDCFMRGILRNTSVMAPAPAFAHAAQLLKELDGLCIGLHGCINAEWTNVKWGPVAPPATVPSLVTTRGHLFQNPTLLHQHGFNPDEIIVELQAQLALARNHGLRIAYLDCHMGFDWLAGVHDRVAAFAAREGLIFHPTGMQRLPEVTGEYANDVARFIARLDAAAPGTYIAVTHPGYVAPDMERLGHGREHNVAESRDWQRRVFMEPAVVDYCARHGVEPIRYTDLQETLP